MRCLDLIIKMSYRLLCQRRCTLTRALVLVVLISFLSFIWLNYDTKTRVTPRREQSTASPPTPIPPCNRLTDKSSKIPAPNDHYSEKSQRIGRRVLVVVESMSNKNAKSIVSSIDAARFPVRVVSDLKNLPTLTHLDRGRFGVIIFETVYLYLDLDEWNRQLIDKYCKEFDVGMIFFTKPLDDYDISYEKIPYFLFTVQYNVALKDYRLNTASSVWRITRPGEVITNMADDNWAVFVCNHSTYEALAFAKNDKPYYDDYEPSAPPTNGTVIPAMLDRGLKDGIRRIFFGNDFSFWLHAPMLMDSISYLSHGKLVLSLDKLIQIDIDDIFVGAVGTRMKAVDVEALVKSQERLQQMIDGFHFMLGFSGWYYQHGTEEENEGDRLLLAYRDKFYWFPHMWRHEQAHKFTEEELLHNMKLNYKFAQEHKIPVKHQYAVAPHHAGVFPVHDALYSAWKSVWDIRVTSTEEYPKLYPSWNRKGFIHKEVMVLPRQTCGLFTKTIYLESYPGGKEKLERSIKGGELFRTFLFNPISIFMTHLSNYGNDRLALYTFESALKFLQCWTNLRIQQKSPMELAIQYFDSYPEEQTPLWRNPCDYDRHLEIWSANKTCEKLPKFLVIGPQKTGTSALYTFLSMHPKIQSNHMSKDTFEEVQFFNGNNYLKGIDWYMDFFPRPANASAEYLFEKSATYFDNVYVPARVKGLLPNVKLICIIIDPAQRAYSWYQHMRAHNDPVAMNMTFYDVITASETAPSKVRSLRNRCLNPGLYEHYLQHWLDYFPSRQVYVVDGERLRNNPLVVMDQVQKFLQIQPHLDYSKVLRFDSSKGFYCQVLTNDKTKCLGRSKGRKYAPMDSDSEKYLQNFYAKHNILLGNLLDKLGVTQPDWLWQHLKN